MFVSLLSLHLSSLSMSVEDWINSSFHYDESVPKRLSVSLALAAAVLAAMAGRGLLSFPTSDGSAVGVVAVSAILSSIMLAKWMWLDDGRSVPAAAILSMLLGAGVLELVCGGRPGTLHASHILLMATPLVMLAVIRSWAMVAWSRRLQESTERTAEALDRVLAGAANPSEFLLHVAEGQKGDELQVSVFDGKLERPGVAPKELFTWPDRGGWYVSEGLVASEETGSAERADYRDPGRQLRVRKVGRTRPVLGEDPRAGIHYSFKAELVGWTGSVVVLLCMACVAAWRIALLQR